MNRTLSIAHNKVRIILNRLTPQQARMLIIGVYIVCFLLSLLLLMAMYALFGNIIKDTPDMPTPNTSSYVMGRSVVPAKEWKSVVANYHSWKEIESKPMPDSMRTYRKVDAHLEDDIAASIQELSADRRVATHKGATISYDQFGLPIGRTWLTTNEWAGKHLPKSSEAYKLFCAWKSAYMTQWQEKAVLALKDICKQQGVNDNIIPMIIAQAVLESGMGITRLGVTANNFFGHKYRRSIHDGRKGVVGAVQAHDDDPDDLFVQYETPWWCFYWHVKLLTDGYGHQVKDKNSLNSWCDGMCGGKGGKNYASGCDGNAKRYSQKLKNVLGSAYYNILKKM
jgi:hypothetical protein